MDRKPLHLLIQGSNWANMLLLACVLVSGVAVSYSGHQYRHLQNELQKELENRNRAQVEWGKLLLELSSLTAPGRVERIAKEKLDMEVPDSSRIRMVVP